MAGKPIATIGSMHVCPLCNGAVPHVGGPVTGPGMAGATINGQPIAVMGDMCTCVGPPDVIVQGCPGVTINGVPVAVVGSMTAHGGQIIQGCPGVTISANTPDAMITMPLKEIPFPKINVLDDIGAFIIGKSKSQSEAKENIKEIKKEAENKEPNPTIYNVRMIKKDKSIKHTREEQKVLIIANVANANDGDTVKFTVTNVDKDGKEGTQKIELSGQVKDGKIEVEWEPPKVEFTEDNNSDNKNELRDGQ